mgnify:CR=1 FL=1
MVGMRIEKIGSHTVTSSDPQSQKVQMSERSDIALNGQQQKADPKWEQYGKENKELVQEAVDKLNVFLEPVRRNLKFELHEKLDKYYVTVIDSKTQEVIKEIPPRKILDMYAAMAEFMGLLVDRKI